MSATTASRSPRAFVARRGASRSRRSRSSNASLDVEHDEHRLPRRGAHRRGGRERRRPRRAGRPRRTRARRRRPRTRDRAHHRRPDAPVTSLPRMLRGATFTVTNFGTEGGRFATPIVLPPQVGDPRLRRGARPAGGRRRRRRRRTHAARLPVGRPPRDRRARRDRLLRARPRAAARPGDDRPRAESSRPPESRRTGGRVGR